MGRLPWNLYQAKGSLLEASRKQYYGTSFWEEFYFEANWQGDMRRAQTRVFDLGFSQTLCVCGGCVRWQKCWWSRFKLMGFGLCPFMIGYGWSFNLGSSRTDSPSLLKGFWHSSSSHVLILWFPGGGMETEFFGSYLRSNILPLCLLWLPSTEAEGGSAARWGRVLGERPVLVGCWQPPSCRLQLYSESNGNPLKNFR